MLTESATTTETHPYREQLKCNFAQIEDVFSDCMDEASTLLSEKGIKDYLSGASLICMIDRGVEPVLVYLEEMLNNYIAHEHMLYELVREVDFKWGQIYEERPHFQKEGERPHREDEYTHKSVKLEIEQLISKIGTDKDF